MTASITALVQAAITVAKDNAINAALPPVTTFLTSLGANASAINFAAQLTSLEANLLAALPNMEQEDIKAITALVQQEVNALAATAETPTPTPAAA